MAAVVSREILFISLNIRCNQHICQYLSLFCWKMCANFGQYVQVFQWTVPLSSVPCLNLPFITYTEHICTISLIWVRCGNREIPFLGNSILVIECIFSIFADMNGLDGYLQRTFLPKYHRKWILYLKEYAKKKLNMGPIFQKKEKKTSSVF